MAKLIIKLINAVGDVVNRDAGIRDQLKVVFLPNFNVSNGQRIYPAADLSEQISTAGKEASGTGNMKFTMNGALTIGTLDGANVEIRDQVGADNFFLFGMDTDGVAALRKSGYRPEGACKADGELTEVIELIRSGFFSRGRHPAVPAAAGQPAVPRPVHGAGRLPVLPGLPAAGERPVRRPGCLGEDGHPQFGAFRPVFLGPDHPRVLPGHLEGRNPSRCGC